MANVKISWGLDKGSGLMKFVNDVPKGKACNCNCPGCGMSLVARKGKKMKWHFAHHSNTDCQGETALHKAAKQILVEEAKFNNELSLPNPQKWAEDGLDLLGNTWRADFRDNISTFLMVNGDEEVRIVDEIQFDVLLFGYEENQLAVEIYVTHKKDEKDEQKLRELGISTLEIDLSKTRWDADRDTLLSEVLWNAPRKWLFCNHIDEGLKTAQLRVLEKIDSVNEGYLNDLEDLIKSLNSIADLDRLGIELPTFSSMASKTLSDGTEIDGPVVTRKVKIQKMDAIWKPLRTYPAWKCLVSIDNNVLINLVVGLDSSSLLNIKVKSPSVICSFRYDESHNLNDLSACFWVGAERWEARIDDIAEKKLNKIVKEKEINYEKSRSFAAAFRRWPDMDKMGYLANKIGVEAPDTYGVYSSHWCNKERIWKAIVWAYRIHNSKWDFFSPVLLAEDKWLGHLTGWPKDENSVSKRIKDLYRWFNVLVGRRVFIQRNDRKFYFRASN